MDPTLVQTERKREHERNLVRAENCVDCLQSETVDGVRGSSCAQDISTLNLGCVTKHNYTTVRRSTDILELQINAIQAVISCNICGLRNLWKTIFIKFIGVLFNAINI